jgi:hypothetical protein
MGYKVPEDYDYTTGGFLEKDENGVVKPGQLTPERLNRILFPHLLEDDDEPQPKKKPRK